LLHADAGTISTAIVIATIRRDRHRHIDTARGTCDELALAVSGVRESECVLLSCGVRAWALCRSRARETSLAGRERERCAVMSLPGGFR